jgi:hypothetical protein
MAKTSLSLNIMFLACNYGSVPLIIFGSLRAISLADLTFEWLLVKGTIPKMAEQTVQNYWSHKLLV